MSSAASLPWATTHVTTTDGAVLRVFALEPASADDHTPTVVLAHGWTLDHRSWEPVVELLAADGRARIVTYDQRGHGGSTLRGGRYRPGGETVRALGDDLAQVIDAVVPGTSPLVLGGHSMGGMTLMAFAGLHPERVRERVAAAVLVATSAGELTGAGIPGEAILMKVLTRLPVRPGRLITPAGQRALGFGDDPRDADMAAVCRQIAGTRLSTTGTFYGALNTHDELAALEHLGKVPVTILVGSKDKLTPPRHAHRLAEAMPSARFEMIDGAGHMLMYEATETVAAALREGIARADGQRGHTA